jgi:hypothetical protein
VFFSSWRDAVRKAPDLPAAQRHCRQLTLSAEAAKFGDDINDLK